MKGTVAVDGLDLNSVAVHVGTASADFVVVVEHESTADTGGGASRAGDGVRDQVVSVGASDDDVELGTVLADVDGSGSGDVGAEQGALDVGSGSRVSASRSGAGND